MISLSNSIICGLIFPLEQQTKAEGRLIDSALPHCLSAQALSCNNCEREELMLGYKLVSQNSLNDVYSTNCQLLRVLSFIFTLSMHFFN